MPDSGVISITEPIEFEIVDDRIHFTCISGKRRTTYALSFHKSRNACHAVTGLLDAHSKRQNVATLPVPLRRKRVERSHS